MEINFKTITNSYIEKKQRLFEKLIKIASDIDTFECVSLENFQLNTEKVSLSRKNMLYFFKITNDISSNRIGDEIARLKSNSKTEIKLPKVNDIIQKDNKILYVGKSNGIFITRLKQHLGKGSNKTYALHLEHWKSNQILKDVELKLYFKHIDSSKYQLTEEEEKVFMEELETALHLHLKPILGRTGH